MRALSLAFFLAFVATLAHSHSNPAMTFSPVADPRAVVTSGNARFTVLTDSIIRMEWAPSAQFQDLATFAFVNRNLPVPQYKVSQTGDFLVIDAANVQVKYLTTSTSSFNSSTLFATIKSMPGNVTWSPGVNDKVGNLLGTVRTLDGVDGSLNLDCQTQSRGDLHCTYGVVSRNGYVVIDDSAAPAFSSNATWPWVVSPTRPSGEGAICNIADSNKRDCGYPGISLSDCQGKGCCYVGHTAENGVPSCYYSTVAIQDLYVFAHGHNYKQALLELTMIGGKVPMMPRFLFGPFYSRYWAYNDIGQKEIVRAYQSYSIPLDVMVTDMDWHITYYKEADQGVKDQAGQTIGWTGFTWDSHLFPSPSAFLSWCKARGLKNTLNLHPASGIQPWEQKYSVMAKAMGIDPSTNIYVPFNATDPKFITNWFQLVLGPMEQAGIDFWWLDWQQGEDWIDMVGVNPTFWLNYLFMSNPFHWDVANSDGTYNRPLILHRWGGLGNHRMQVGFSGDVVPSWASLDFQVYFTLTASNVAYGFWSHDLGGHTQPSPPELMTRWVQWGIFSPMFRTHCTKNADNDRRIWMYPPANFQIMRSAMQLRSQMIPYIYTMARFAHDNGIGMIRPMYYEYPESDEAYSFKTQYFFGDQLLVSPVTTAMNATSGLATKSIWIPSGDWVSLSSGATITGPTVISGQYALDEIPVFAKAGAIVTMRNEGTGIGSSQIIPSTLKLSFYPSTAKENSTYFYEDDGKTTEHDDSQAYTFTSVKLIVVSSSAISVVVSPPDGPGFPELPSKRSYELHFHNVWPASSVSVNGVSLSPLPYLEQFPLVDGYSYDGTKLTLIVYLASPRDVASALTIDVRTISSNTDPLILRSHFVGLLHALSSAKELLDDQWGTSDQVYQEDYTNLLYACEAGERITANPATATTELTNFAQFVAGAVVQVSGLGLASSVKATILAQLTREEW